MKYIKKKRKEKRKGKFNRDTAVINLSERKLSKAEISLLEKGLTFVPTNRKMDLTVLLTEIKEWERRLRLKEFFFDKESNTDEENT